MQDRGIFKRIGPAFVVGAVIIGPGSVTLMSQTGATYGYSMLWLSLLAGALMAGFIALFMRFGIYCDDTFLGLTAKKLGRWYAALCGIALFLAGSAFQTGNSLGVTAAMDALVLARIPQIVWPILFTAAAIIFMFSFKSIYRIIEKTMTLFLVGMFVAFLTNLIWARPDPGAALKGACIPTIPEGADWVTLGGLVATTCVIAAAFFQSYLVKAKGWKAGDLAHATTDTILASICYTLIGTVIMMTAARVLHGNVGKVTFESMVAQLQVVFGTYGRIIFCIGFWAAAFSSFITNALISGLLLSDGLGIGSRLDSTSTKVCATVALLVGMTTAIVIIRFAPDKPAPPATVATADAGDETQPEDDAAADRKPPRDIKVASIAIGQASTMLAVPFGVIAMVLILFDGKATQGRDLPLWAKAFVLFGAAVLLGTAAVTYTKIKPEFVRLFGLG